MVVLVDIKTADLAKKPVIRQRLGPRGVDHKARRFAGFGGVVYPCLTQQPFENATVFQDITAGIGRPTGADQQNGRQRGHPSMPNYESDHQSFSPLTFVRGAGLPQQLPK